MRLFLLTILILFSIPLAGENENLLFQLSINGPSTELIRWIEKYASPNTRRSDGLTPLIAAVQANNLSSVTILLEHGADASIADTMNFDSFYWALHKSFYQIADVLLAHGVNINRPNSQGNSPLISAVMRGDLAAAYYLLQHGADRKRKSGTGLAPEIIASRNHDKAMIKLLSSFTPKEQSWPIVSANDTIEHEVNCKYTDAKVFFAAIQSGRRNFSSCSFIGMDFKGMRLYGLNFKGANLSGCDLRGTDMRYCDLSGATLRNAFLHRADLRHARVENTDFSDAMLTASDLRETEELSLYQLRSARNLYKMKLDSETVEVLQRDYPNLFKDPGGAWSFQPKTTSNSK
jgi:hypothetical protein